MSSILKAFGREDKDKKDEKDKGKEHKDHKDGDKKDKKKKKEKKEKKPGQEDDSSSSSSSSDSDSGKVKQFEWVLDRWKRNVLIIRAANYFQQLGVPRCVGFHHLPDSKDGRFVELLELKKDNQYETLSVEKCCF
ncbi:PREDICTED: nucleolar protein of 40 kDa isoform X1 [Thamnophis sirtalis]|uniref:Nucleolar protein of 40 kDa isoform X1 n=1 Tax=Thamnophis sirtalis TaxID=35019 RepID=A0A6I9Y011_9SAUR|nr:PREDICTED: nucleolar protein of 40 kDa isoform X1 [Thamnophis sirtalis]